MELLSGIVCNNVNDSHELKQWEPDPLQEPVFDPHPYNLRRFADLKSIIIVRFQFAAKMNNMFSFVSHSQSAACDQQQKHSRLFVASLPSIFVFKLRY